MRIKELVCAATGLRRSTSVRGQTVARRLGEEEREEEFDDEEELSEDNAENPKYERRNSNSSILSSLTQESDSVQEAFQKIEQRRSQQRSERISKRISVQSMEEACRNTLLDTHEEIEDPSNLPTVEEVDELEEEEKEESEEMIESFTALTEIFREGNRDIIIRFCAFLSVRQVVELSFLSHVFLNGLEGIPLRLEYYKRTFDFNTLDRTFNEYYRSTRMTPWKVGGLYTAINDLSTLFEAVDPEELDFLGIVNPNISSIKHIVQCTSLRRFELHGCEKEISLEPLLQLKDSLRGVSLLACKEIRDVTVLQRLPHLRIMSTFKSSNVQALPDLSMCSGLELLSIGECGNIRDIRAIRYLHKLRVLDLSYVRCVTSLSFLKNATSLRVLILDSCKYLEDIAALKVFGENLQVLRLNGIMNLNNIDGVRHCPKLVSLEMSDLVHVKDLSPLENCPLLQDLMLRNCVSVSTLQPLQVCREKIRRLVISGCRNIKAEEDATLIHSFPELIVFECVNCPPEFLVYLMLGEKSAVQAATEPRVVSLSKADFVGKAYPAVVDTFEKAGSDARLHSTLQMISQLCENSFALAHMVEEDMVHDVFQLVFGDHSQQVKLDALRVLSSLSKAQDSSKKLAAVENGVEWLVSCIADTQPCTCCDTLWAHRSSLSDEYILGEAARILALLLLHTTADESSHADIVSRMDCVEVLKACSFVLVAAATLDQTKRPVLLLVKAIVEADASLAEEFIGCGGIQSTMQSLQNGSVETRIFGTALLAVLTKNTGAETVARILQVVDAASLLTTFVQSARKDLQKHTLEVLQEAPPRFRAHLVQTPGLVSSILDVLSQEIASRASLFTQMSQLSGQDDELILSCAKVLQALSSSKDCVKDMVLEDFIEDKRQTARALNLADPEDVEMSLIPSQRDTMLSIGSARTRFLTGHGVDAFARLRERNQSLGGFTESEVDGGTDFEEDGISEYFDASSDVGDSRTERSPRLRSGTEMSSSALERSRAERGFRISCNRFGQVFAEALELTSGVDAKAAIARTMINFCEYSESVRSVIFGSFAVPPRMTQLVDLVVMQNDSPGNVDVGLELMHMLLQDKVRAEMFAKLSPPKVHELCKALVLHAHNPEAEMVWTSRVVGTLLASPLKRAMQEWVVAPIVSAIYNEKRKSQVSALMTLLRDRRKMDKLLDNPPSQEQLMEEVYHRKLSALRFLTALIVERQAKEAGAVLLAKNRLEAVFASMMDPHLEIQELALVLMSHILHNYDVLEERKTVGGRLAIELRSLFDSKPVLGVNCLCKILMEGTRMAKKSSVRIMSYLAEYPRFARLFLGPAEDDKLDEKLENLPSSVDKDEAKQEDQSEHQHQIESPRGSRLERLSRRLSDKSERKGLDEGQSGRESLSRRLSKRLSTFSKSSKSSKSNKKSQAGGEVVLCTVSTLEALLEFVLLEESLEQHEERQEEEEIIFAYHLVERLTEFGAEKVQEVLLAPLVMILSTDATSTMEQHSQERVAALFDLLSQTGDAQATTSLLVAANAYEALTQYFCSPAATVEGKERCVSAIGKYVNGDPNKILSLDQFSLASSDDSTSFLRELVSEMQSDNPTTRGAILQMFQVVFGDVRPVSSDGSSSSSSSSSIGTRAVPPVAPTSSRLSKRRSLQLPFLGQVEGQHTISASPLRIEANPIADKNGSKEINTLSSCLIGYGLMEILADWQHSVASNDGQLKTARDIEFGHVLLKSALHASEVDSAVAGQLQSFHFLDLFVHLLLTDNRPEMRELYSRILVDLDPDFLFDGSEIFKGTLLQDQQFAELMEKEQVYEWEQLSLYPVAFQRVRGFPLPYSYEELNEVTVGSWTTMSIMRHTSRGQVKVVHQKIYYEVELIECSPDVVFGWVSQAFKTGVFQGFSKYGVGLDPESWGVRANFLQDWQPTDVLGFAADLEERRLTFTLNGRVVFLQGIPGETEIHLLPAVTGRSFSCKFNFGSQPFKFSPPSRHFRSVFQSVSIVE